MLDEKTIYVRCKVGHQSLPSLEDGEVYQVEQYLPHKGLAGAFVLKGIANGKWFNKSRFEEVAYIIPKDTIQPPINNYTCTSCHNDRCNTGEKSCWKCGALIPST